MPQRVTLPLLTVVAVLLERPTAERHGYAIAKDTFLSGGTVQQILARLERDGWLTSREEDIDPHVAGRRPRRLYKLTGAGQANAEQMMRDHAHRIRGAAALGRLAPRLPAIGVLEWVATRLGATPRHA